MSVKVFISAGELSGDQHGASIVDALRTRLGPFECFGMGGRRLRASGVETIVDSEQHASIMGITRVLTNLPTILRILFKLKTAIKERKPALAILVDYQDFNFRLARIFHASGIPVLFFISPSVWAWRASRIKLVKRLVTRMALIFPFEKAFYQERGCLNTTYVGHPFFDNFSERKRPEKSALFDHMKLEKDRPTLAILPGSRPQEIQAHLPVVLKAWEMVRARMPHTQAVIPRASSLPPEVFSEFLPQITRIGALQIHEVDSLDLMQTADAGLLKSGTSNLEAAFCDTPFAMFYRLDWFTGIVVKQISKLEQYSMVNIIRPNTVTEMVQERFTSELIAQETERLLSDTAYRNDIRKGLAEVTTRLSSHDDLELFKGTKSAAERVAALAEEILSSQL